MFVALPYYSIGSPCQYSIRILRPYIQHLHELQVAGVEAFRSENSGITRCTAYIAYHTSKDGSVVPACVRGRHSSRLHGPTRPAQGDAVEQRICCCVFRWPRHSASLFHRWRPAHLVLPLILKGWLRSSHAVDAGVLDRVSVSNAVIDRQNRAALPLSAHSVGFGCLVF